MRFSCAFAAQPMGKRVTTEGASARRGRSDEMNEK
jgi:hypothetical protein